GCGERGGALSRAGGRLLRRRGGGRRDRARVATAEAKGGDAMIRHGGWLAVVLGALVVGVAAARHPTLNMVADSGCSASGGGSWSGEGSNQYGATATRETSTP